MPRIRFLCLQQIQPLLGLQRQLHYLPAATPTTVSKAPTRAPLQPLGSKRGAPDASVVQVGAIVLVKVHGRSTTDKAKGKLAAKVEGSCYLASFTDDTQTMANIEDAEGTAWKRKTSDLSKYTGNA